MTFGWHRTIKNAHLSLKSTTSTPARGSRNGPTNICFKKTHTHPHPPTEKGSQSVFFWSIIHLFPPNDLHLRQRYSLECFRYRASVAGCDPIPTGNWWCGPTRAQRGERVVSNGSRFEKSNGQLFPINGMNWHKKFIPEVTPTTNVSVPGVLCCAVLRVEYYSRAPVRTEPYTG